MNKDITYCAGKGCVLKNDCVRYIDGISGKGTWDSNPWVVAYEFEMVQ